MQDQTSLKGLFQGMIPDAMAVVRGKVTKAAPLEIQVINDDKLVLTENIICLPRHLSDYTTTCDLMLDQGRIDSETHPDGNHSVAGGTHGGHEGGDGSHTHEGGAHVHRLRTYNIYQATIKVYNALKVGEMVYILSFNQGKKYYILDREVQT